TSDRLLIEKITDATNTQTPINYRDKISNKNFNTLTKEVFRNAGINYVTKRGESFARQASSVSQESVESETVIKYWFATYFEDPQTAKNSISSVLQKVFDASTLDKHPLEDLFKGDVDSAIYQQLLHAYRIYRFVQKAKGEHLSTHEVLAYCDELMAYGIYKYLTKAGYNKDVFGDQEKLREAFFDTLQTIEAIVEKDKALHQAHDRTFSYNAYFKKPKSKVDFNNEKHIIESDTLYDDLKNRR